MTNLIRTTNLRGYKALVSSLGGDPLKLLQELHVPDDLEDKNDAFMPFRQLALLLEISANKLNCPDFGLRISQWQGPSILGPIAVMIRNADSVQSAMEGVAKYLHVHSPALSFSILPPDTNGNISFVFHIDEPKIPLQQGYELTIANAVHALRMLGGEATLPIALHFSHKPISSSVIIVEKVFTTKFTG